MQNGGVSIQEKIKSFVYYGSKNYISLASLRAMVPSAYLFLSFFALVAGIAGDAIPAALAFLAIVVLYSLIVYTFPLWCPKPSFACRFAMSAFSTLSISIIFQAWIYTILFAAKQIDIFDVCIVIALQILSATIYYCITKFKINKGKFLSEKSYKTNISIGVIAGAAYGGVRFGRMLHNLNSAMAGTLAMICFAVFAAVCAAIATGHILKYYFYKKYNIDCDENGDTTSPLLFAEKREKKSLPKRIWSVTWKVLLLLLLIAILYGISQVRQ